LKANFIDQETGQVFWIAKARKGGDDRLYKGAGDPPVIDDDVAEEYWRDVRGVSAPEA
jgi:hypothetical protein